MKDTTHRLSIVFQTFRVAQPLHFNMDDIPKPVPASPALYQDASTLTLIDVQPTLTNVPPVATNDTAETSPLRSGLRNTLPLLGDIQQASSDCSLSGSESLPVSVDVGSQPNTLLSDEPPIQSRNLTPVSSI